MPYPSRTSLKIVAVVFGILAAGAPIVLFNAWLKKQGEDEATITAASALASTEIRIGETIAALQDLSARGIDSCKPAHIEAMRDTALLTGPIKQVMLVAPNGDALCADTNGLVSRQEVLTSQSSANPDVMLDVTKLRGRGERFLRIRRIGASDKPALAALVPVSLLLSQRSAPGGPSLGTVLSMTDGTELGDSVVRPDTAAEAVQYSASVRSTRYPLMLTASMPRSGVVADYDDLRRISIVFSGSIAFLILLFALLLARRQPADQNAEMAKAVRNDEFIPYYQPLVDLQTGRLLGAEVLVRWRGPDGDMIEPSSFVSHLESSGLVLEFTRKLMRRVRKELAGAVGQRRNMSIAFNVAPRHFDDALILHDVASIFDGSGIRLSQIVLELTERHEVADLTSMRRTIAALQRVGCRVAIDDVGTGHSGLSYILKLGVDIIKIDKMFVDAIGPEGPSKAIIDTLIDLAKNMRMEIIAEGVETFDQVTFLRERGIGAAQGYVFAPPLPAGTFLQLLEAMDPIAATAEPAGVQPAKSSAAG